jgi:hypothetical protein
MFSQNNVTSMLRIVPAGVEKTILLKIKEEAPGSTKKILEYRLAECCVLP